MLDYILYFELTRSAHLGYSGIGVFLVLDFMVEIDFLI